MIQTKTRLAAVLGPAVAAGRERKSCCVSWPSGLAKKILLGSAARRPAKGDPVASAGGRPRRNFEATRLLFGAGPKESCRVSWLAPQPRWGRTGNPPYWISLRKSSMYILAGLGPAQRKSCHDISPPPEPASSPAGLSSQASESLAS